KKLSAFLNFAYEYSLDMLNFINTDTKAAEYYGPAFSSDLELWKKLREMIKNPNYEEIRTAIRSHTKEKLKDLRGDAYATFRERKALRKTVYDDFDKISDRYFFYTVDEIKSSLTDNSNICALLYELLSDFNKRLMSEKASRGICNFNDIRRFVLDILCNKDGSPTEVALEYRDKFDYIYIDEYQDVDPVQDAIFEIISRPNNRFMVGDIKQSIYGFRNADPSIFAGYKNSMPEFKTKESDCYSLFMSDNFRCDRHVVDFSNAVSSFLFSHRAESIGYSHKDDLIYAKKLPNPDNQPVPAVVAITGILPQNVNLNTLTDDEKNQQKRSSERYIAREIKRLVDTEYLNDIKKDGKIEKRKIKYSDITILSRQKKRFPILIEELKKLGIPTECEKDCDFFENPDVLLVLSLLSAIDNPQKDISLAGVLRSPFFGFSLEDIMTVRAASAPVFSLYDALKAYSENDSQLGRACKNFEAQLQYWRNAAAAMPCDKLIKKLYHEMSILSYGKSRKNLLRLYEYAIKFESNGFKGLYGFIKYVNDLIECKVKLPDSSDNDTSDCVKIMTIHHSKGLEFPVCFIYETEKGFSNRSMNEDIQFEPGLGIGFTPRDNSGFAKFETPIWRSISDTRKILEREEEMRLLYVAMTRAKERLYLVSNLTNPDSKELSKTICKYDTEYAILRANSYIDWVLTALSHSPKNDFYTLTNIEFGNDEQKSSDASDSPVLETVQPENSETEASDSSGSETVQPQNREKDVSSLVEMFENRFNHEYPYEHISKLPAKLAVSSLSPRVLDSYDTSAASQSDLDGDFDELFEKEFTVPQTLGKTDQNSGAELGTATHAFLQFCDFDKVVSNGVEAEIKRLKDNRFIPDNYADMIKVEWLNTFFGGEFFQKIRSAKEVWREERFNLFLPAIDFTDNKTGPLKDETIAVQGVIDIFFEDKDGKIILCDYKTDKLTPKELEKPYLAARELNKRYANQLSYYARAIEEILGRAPDETLIYSLPLGRTVKVYFER
ncbi:MAG: UvrD-helicase domain-containing protein, partial [Clostridia bacterium]|nr:UvrD-helicase domain-containing protein [Clostridia bacterium]